MSDWKDRLGAFDDLEPDESVYRRSRQGPRRELPDAGPSTARRITAGLVAFAVFAAAGIFAWQAFRPTTGRTVAGDDERDWPDLVLRVAEGEGEVSAMLTFGHFTQALPVGFEGDETSPESPWFSTAVPVGTQLRIEQSGDVDVAAEVGGRSTDFGGSERPDPVDEFPQVQGTFSMIFSIDSAGRHGGAGAIIQVLDLRAASESILTVRHWVFSDGSDPTAMWMTPSDTAMGAIDQIRRAGAARTMSVPTGSLVALGGDADQVEFSLSGEERQVTETSDADPQPFFAMPSAPGTYDADVTGIWGQERVEFSFKVELQPTGPDDGAPPDPDPTTTPVEDTQSDSPPTQVQEASDVLRVRCDADSIEALTPTVTVQSDGLHVSADVTGMTDPEVSVRSESVPEFNYSSGSEGTDGEFVREVPVGEAEVHCESGPGQGDGPEKLAAGFTIVDSSEVFTDYDLACPQSEGLGGHGPSEGMPASAEDAVRGGVNGLFETDVVDLGGYLGIDVARPIVRVTRDGERIGWFMVRDFADQGYFILAGYTCPDSGLSIAGVDG